MSCLSSVKNYIVNAETAPQDYTFNSVERFGNLLLNPMKRIITTWENAGVLKKAALVIATLIAFPLGVIGAIFKKLGSSCHDRPSIEHPPRTPQISETRVDRFQASVNKHYLKMQKLQGEDKFNLKLQKAGNLIQKQYDDFKKNGNCEQFSTCIKLYNKVMESGLLNIKAFMGARDTILTMQNQLIEMHDTPIVNYLEGKNKNFISKNRTFCPLFNEILKVTPTTSYRQPQFGSVMFYVECTLKMEDIFKNPLFCFKDIQVILRHQAEGDGQLMTVIAFLPRISDDDVKEAGHLIVRDDAMKQYIDKIAKELEAKAKSWGYETVQVTANQNSKARMIALTYPRVHNKTEE